MKHSRIALVCLGLLAVAFSNAARAADVPQCYYACEISVPSGFATYPMYNRILEPRPWRSGGGCTAENPIYNFTDRGRIVCIGAGRIYSDPRRDPRAQSCACISSR